MNNNQQDKPAEAKPAEAKPADAKPADAKPADAKPAEGAAPGAASGNGTAGGNGTGGNSTTDVYGAPHPNGTIDHPNITDCNQVVVIKGQRIKDFADYNQRVQAVLTLSPYFINLLESNAQGSLLESIEVSHMKSEPQTLGGTLQGCLLFQDSVTNRNATICPEKNETLPHLKGLWENILACRRGSKPTSKDVNGLNLTQALGNGTINPALFKQALKEELKTIGLEAVDVDKAVQDNSASARLLGKMAGSPAIPGTEEADPWYVQKQKAKLKQGKNAAEKNQQNNPPEANPIAAAGSPAPGK